MQLDWVVVKNPPYDKGIVGYVVDDEGNGRIVYDDYECCMSLSQSLGISEEDAFDDWGL